VKKIGNGAEKKVTMCNTG